LFLRIFSVPPEIGGNGVKSRPVPLGLTTPA
jgi:hypothetical protein